LLAYGGMQFASKRGQRAAIHFVTLVSNLHSFQSLESWHCGRVAGRSSSRPPGRTALHPV